MRQISGKRFLARLRGLHKQSEGSTAIEDAMVASLMGVALIAAMASLGQSVAGTYGKVGSAIEGSPDMPGPTTAAASMAAAPRPGATATPPAAP